jgi:uncharacterized protein (TIGR02246 family)
VRQIAVAALALGAVSFAGAPDGRLSSADEAKIRAVNEAYAAAWQKNDPAAVRATLWPDAVLIPQGSTPVKGLDAINRFWWPASGPGTTVTGFTVTTDELGGAGAIGFARGDFQLAFSYEDTGKSVTRRNRGNYLMIFTRREAEWRISHRMWSDLP